MSIQNKHTEVKDDRTKIVITTLRQVISTELVSNRLEVSCWFYEGVVQFKTWYDT